MSSPEISADFPYQSKYLEVLGSRMHYVEEGSADGPVFLFLHGNPTWSYLWRNVIPHVAPLGRAIAVDLIGMGRSDKPDIPYRFFDHARYLDAFIETRGLGDVTLILHDWGSALGFHWARRHPDNVRGIAFMEAILSPVRWRDFRGGFKAAFKLFRSPFVGGAMISGLNVFVKQVLPRTVVRKLTAAEMSYYLEPYPTLASRRPVRQWPREIPIDGEPADVHAAVASYNAWLQRCQVPKLLIHARPGALITRRAVEVARERFPNLETREIGRGLHFVQEDDPHGIGEAIAAWARELP